jgi:uncharacterized integral membrane protein
MRFLYWALILIVAVFAADFAVSNREIVDLSFWPLSGHLTLSLYLSVLPPVLAAFLLGWLFGWMRGAKLRATRRRQARRIAELEAEAGRLRQAMAAHADPAGADPSVVAPPLTEQQRATLAMAAH